MQLNEILEENSIKAIAKKTNISEENLEALFHGEFSLLKKVKTMGFISIVEREYKADLSDLRKQAQEYYASNREEDGIVLDAPIVERRGGKPKLLVVVSILLLGVATWYFVTQFDKEKFRQFLPFNEEKMVDDLVSEVDQDPNLSIVSAIETEETHTKTDDTKEKNASSIESNRSIIN